MDHQIIINKISKGASFLLIGIFLSKFFTYLYRLIIARYLGPDIYGLFSIGLAVLGIILSIVLLGLPQGILRYVSYYSGKRDELSIYAVINNVIKIILPVSLFFSILLFISAEWISISIFHNADLIKILKLFSIIIPISAIVSCIDYVLQAFQKIKFLVISRNIIEPLSKLILSVIAIYLGFKIIGITIVYLISVFVVALLLIFFLKKIISFKKLISAKFIMSKQLLYFSLPLMLADMFTMLLVWSDTLILGYFVGVLQVGVYNAAVPTARLIHIMPVALRTLFIPTIGSLYAQKKNFTPIYQTISKWMFLIGMPSVVLLCLYSKQILFILFGQAFVSGYMALVLITMSFFIYSLLLTSETILMIMKKTKLILFNTSLTVVLNLILNFIFIPLYGIMGAAFATSVSFIFMSILIFIENYYFTKLIPIKWSYLKGLVSALLSLLVLLYLNKYLNSYNLLNLIFLGMIYLSIYLILLFISKALDKEELTIIKLIWKKIIGRS